MKDKLFQLRFTERNGEQQYSYEYLIAALCEIEATEKAHSLVKQWYADPGVEKDGENCYAFFGGCLTVEIESVFEITLVEYLSQQLLRYGVGYIPAVKNLASDMYLIELNS